MNIIVVSAHPDDEIIGAGGTLFRHLANNDKLYWLIITNVFEHQGFSNDRVVTRQEEIRKITERVGFTKVFNLNYPTTSLSSSSLQDMVPKISHVFQEILPETIYCVNRSDIHSDHRIVFQAVMACTKSFRFPSVRKILLYECLSETEMAPALHENIFIPNYFIDISDFMEDKLEAVKIYESEIAAHPFPRSQENIKALAIFRGATVGVKYAEAFQLIKWIEK